MTAPTKRITSTTLACLALLFLYGCKNTYEMQVDAIKNPDPVFEDAESYVIVPRDPDTDTSDLRYQETVTWIKTALSAKGMYEATDPLEADMVIEVEYGMEPPRQEVQIREEPVFARIQEPGTYQTITVIDPVTKMPTTRRIYIPGRVTTEMVGYEKRAVTIVINEKYLVLTAKENSLTENSDDAPEQLWSVTVKNNDSSDNLREYLPIMASAATDYIGEDTENEQTVRLKSDDEVVDFVKKGLAKEAPADTQ